MPEKPETNTRNEMHHEDLSLGPERDDANPNDANPNDAELVEGQAGDLHEVDPASGDSDGLAIDDETLSRVIEGRARPEDWSTLARTIGGDPRGWQRLRELSRLEEHVRALGRIAETRATRVDLSAVGVGVSPSPNRTQRRGGSSALAWGLSALGWTAALLLFVQFGAGRELATPSPSGLDQLFVSSPRSAAEAWSRYESLGREEGSFVEQLPLQVVGTRPTAMQTGKEAVEVLFVRRILERAVLDRGYDVTFDELGRASVVLDLESSRDGNGPY